MQALYDVPLHVIYAELYSDVRAKMAHPGQVDSPASEAMERGIS